MTTTQEPAVMCPFCPIVDPWQRYPVDAESSICGIACCVVCEWTAHHHAIEEELVEDLRERQTAVQPQV